MKVQCVPHGPALGNSVPNVKAEVEQCCTQRSHRSRVFLQRNGRRATPPPESWPILMRASTAAAYLDEVSVYSFRRRVGTLYPRPLRIRGRGELWLRDDLDKSIDELSCRVDKIRDAADVL